MQSLPYPWRCAGGWLLWGWCWLACASLAQAQLTVLSQGNRQAQWRQSQLASIQQQLSEPQLNRELALELKAQLKWLSAWKPGGLSRDPLWTSRAVDELWQEPAIDPAGIATDLRDRLLGKSARPTAADTRELQKMLVEYADDVGVRQLHLHWLDQAEFRQTYPAEIAQAAAQVLALLDGIEEPDEDVERARAYCLYRRGRALAYRELPQVLAEKPLDGEAKAQNQADLVGAYRQLKQLVPEDRPEFVLLDIRMLRNDNWNGRGLVLLEDFSSHVDPQWYLKKRRDMLRALGWEAPAREAADIYAAAYPAEAADDRD